MLLLVPSKKCRTAGKCNFCWAMNVISARDDVTPLLISQGYLLGVVLL